MAEIVEEMSEDVDANGKALESISRCKPVMSFLAQQVFKPLSDSYRNHFIFEEFMRLLHDAKEKQEEHSNLLIDIHETTLDAL